MYTIGIVIVVLLIVRGVHCIGIVIVVLLIGRRCTLYRYSDSSITNR